MFRKGGIIASPGDRRDEDIEKLGYLSGMMFDKIIIRHDKEDRGRASDEITKLLLKGVRSAAADKQVIVIPDEIQAMEWCMINCAKGAFIVACTEEVQASIQYLTHEKNKETLSISTCQ